MKFCFAILLVLAIAAFAEIECGIIDKPIVFTKEHSPYRITGDIQISPGARLTIEAGVEVHIVPGEACGETKQIDWSDSTGISIKANGPLVIKGTAAEPVRILPEKHVPGKIQWDGIRLSSRERMQVEIEYLHIMGAAKAIKASYSRFNVGNSLFIGNGTGIWMENEADLAIYNCVFTENLSSGIYISNSRPTIAANIFYKNTDFGILSDSRQSPRIQNNIFFANASTDCRFCPVGVSIILKNEKKHFPTDKFGNIYSDPIFTGTEKEKSMAKADLDIPTPIKDAKDTTLYKMYEKSHEAPHPPVVQPTQLYRPSKYSPAINAAPKTDFFRNADDSYGDIGIYGGKSGRYNKIISL